MTSINFRKMLEQERCKAVENIRNSAPPPSTSACIEEIGQPTDKLLTSSTLSHFELSPYPFISDFHKYKVGTIDSIFYIPDYITTSEEAQLKLQIYAHTGKWTQLKKRRLQNWGGIPNPQGMVAEELPQFLLTITRRLVESGVFQQSPNHVLLNEYSAGQGIMPHKDGPLYYPKVAILSLCAPAIIGFRENLKSPPQTSVLLQPQSLLIFSESAYTTYFHGIEEVEYDTITECVVNTVQAAIHVGTVVERGTRLSLTIRIVPNLVSDLPATAEAAEESRRIESF